MIVGKNTQKLTSVGGDVEKLETSCIADEKVIRVAAGAVWQLLNLLNKVFPCDTAIALLGIYPKELKAGGTLLWHNGLRTRHRHCSSLSQCCAASSSSGPGTPTCCGHDQRKKKKRKIKSRDSNQYSYTHVHSNILPNIQKVGTTQVPNDR